MAKTKSELDGKVRGWILGTHPEERDLIGEFDREITWREVARRMLAGECFYDICDCTESVQREYAFQRMSELFATDYDFLGNFRHPLEVSRFSCGYRGATRPADQGVGRVAGNGCRGAATSSRSPYLGVRRCFAEAAKACGSDTKGLKKTSIHPVAIRNAKEYTIPRL